MEDPLTEDPPPSRFFDEDLNNFTPRSPPLSPPSLTFSNSQTLNTPSLLIVAISSPSIHLINHLSSKTLIGTLTLPESPTKSSSHIYSLNDVVIVSIDFPIPAERSHVIAKHLLGQIRPEKVLILDSVQSRNFRGRLPPDEDLVFKLETAEEKTCNDVMVKADDVDYFPSGSLVEGVGAAVLARCQLMKIRGSLCVSWPELGHGVALKVKTFLEGLIPKVNFDLYCNNDLGVYRVRNSRANSEMYT